VTVARPYRDKFGFRYSDAVQNYWGPRLIKLLGIRLAKRSPQDVADDRAEIARAMMREWARTS
jgi:hypothetical protein